MILFSWHNITTAIHFDKHHLTLPTGKGQHPIEQYANQSFSQDFTEMFFFNYSTGIRKRTGPNVVLSSPAFGTKRSIVVLPTVTMVKSAVSALTGERILGI